MLSDDDKRTVIGILRTHAELSDKAALDGTVVLARLRIAEPDNPLTLAMAEDLRDVEEDCADLLRIAAQLESELGVEENASR